MTANEFRELALSFSEARNKRLSQVLGRLPFWQFGS